MILFDNIKNRLDDFLLENSKYAPLLTTVPSDGTFPNVVIEKIDDREHACDNTRNSVFSTWSIELNIYAVSTTYKNKKVSARSVAVELEELIFYYMGEKMGFKRTYDKPSPNVDQSVYRITMRFQTRINNKRNSFIR